MATATLEIATELGKEWAGVAVGNGKDRRDKDSELKLF